MSDKKIWERDVIELSKVDKLFLIIAAMAMIIFVSADLILSLHTPACSKPAMEMNHGNF